eukprot:scaffold71959_cov21-Tisochrysis_lutea.AAC.3
MQIQGRLRMLHPNRVSKSIQRTRQNWSGNVCSEHASQGSRPAERQAVPALMFLHCKAMVHAAVMHNEAQALLPNLGRQAGEMILYYIIIYTGTIAAIAAKATHHGRINDLEMLWWDDKQRFDP